MSNAVNSKLTDFRIDNSGGTLTDISVHCDSVQLNREAPEIDVTTFQDTARSYIADFDGAELTVSGNANATVMTVLHGIVGLNTSSFQWGAEGTATGKRKMTGETVCLSVTDGGQIGQANKFQARFRVVGAITFGTY